MSAPADKIGLTLIPFPSGKGQLNMPKNHYYRGKVIPHPTHCHLPDGQMVENKIQIAILP